MLIVMGFEGCQLYAFVAINSLAESNKQQDQKISLLSR